MLMMSRSVPDEKSVFFPFHEEETCGSATKSRDQAFIIGVCGGTASGKTTVCDRILEQLQGNQRVVILSMDSYYRGLSATESAHAEDYNFDHPDAFDWELIKSHLSLLKRRKPIEVPHYDFKTHSRTQQTTPVYGADVILFEGILVFAEKGVRDLMDIRVFVDTDDDTRLIRRIRRDIKDRGRNLEGTLVQYERFVKPSFEMYIAPTKKYADVIIPRGNSNTIAIDLIVQHIKQELERRTPAKKR